MPLCTAMLALGLALCGDGAVRELYGRECAPVLEDRGPAGELARAVPVVFLVHQRAHAETSSSSSSSNSM